MVYCKEKNGIALIRQISGNLSNFGGVWDIKWVNV